MTAAGQERYEQLRREHRWVLPERYNIAADVCDRHPADALAMVHERHDGVVRECHWGELQALSNQAANLLATLGVQRGDRVAVVLPPTAEAAAKPARPVRNITLRPIMSASRPQNSSRLPNDSAYAVTTH